MSQLFEAVETADPGDGSAKEASRRVGAVYFLSACLAKAAVAQVRARARDMGGKALLERFH